MNAEKTGALIRALRKEKNLTQQQFADLLSVSDKAVSRWETGKGFPDIGNLEDLAETLGVSVAELLKGERFETQITRADVDEVSSAGFALARRFAAKRKGLHLAVGFLSGAVLLILIFIHLLSPVPIGNAEQAVSVETLSDGELVAVLDENADGYEIGTLTEPDTNLRYVTLNCYKTLWGGLFGSRNKTIVSLGKQTDIDYVSYYPADDADEIVWTREGLALPNGGMVTLPRLIYNYWLAVGAALSVIGIAVCLLLRKKRRIGTVVRITAAPVAFTISTAAVLAGRFGTVYSAPYYFSGILLSSACLYALFILLYKMYRTKQKEKNGSAVLS